MDCLIVVYGGTKSIYLATTNCRIQALSQADTEDVKMVEGLVLAFRKQLCRM